MSPARPGCSWSLARPLRAGGRVTCPARDPCPLPGTPGPAGTDPEAFLSLLLGALRCSSGASCQGTRITLGTPCSPFPAPVQEPCVKKEESPSACDIISSSLATSCDVIHRGFWSLLGKELREHVQRCCCTRAPRRGETCRAEEQSVVRWVARVPQLCRPTTDRPSQLALLPCFLRVPSCSFLRV